MKLSVRATRKLRVILASSIVVSITLIVSWGFINGQICEDSKRLLQSELKSVEVVDALDSKPMLGYAVHTATPIILLDDLSVKDLVYQKDGTYLKVSGEVHDYVASVVPDKEADPTYVIVDNILKLPLVRQKTKPEPAQPYKYVGRFSGLYKIDRLVPGGPLKIYIRTSPMFIDLGNYGEASFTIVSTPQPELVKSFVPVDSDPIVAGPVISEISSRNGSGLGGTSVLFLRVKPAPSRFLFRRFLLHDGFKISFVPDPLKPGWLITDKPLIIIPDDTKNASTKPYASLLLHHKTWDYLVEPAYSFFD